MCEDYAWNPSISTCECDKNCDITKYLNDCTLINSFVDDIIVACIEIVDMSETTSISSANKVYWLLCALRLAIACLLLFRGQRC